MSDTDKIPPVRNRPSDLRRKMQVRREAAIAHWSAAMPGASDERVASFAGTSATTVMKWRKARVGNDRPDTSAVDVADS
jgi:hypothetical protein